MFRVTLCSYFYASLFAHPRGSEHGEGPLRRVCEVENGVAIRGEARGHLGRGVLSRAGLVVAGQVPLPHGAVVAGGGEGGRVGGPRDRRDDVRVALHLADESGGGDVPDLDLLVVAGRGEGLAVGGEGHGVHAGVVGEDADLESKVNEY